MASQGEIKRNMKDHGPCEGNRGSQEHRGHSDKREADTEAEGSVGLKTRLSRSRPSASDGENGERKGSATRLSSYVLCPGVGRDKCSVQDYPGNPS